MRGGERKNNNSEVEHTHTCNAEPYICIPTHIVTHAMLQQYKAHTLCVTMNNRLPIKERVYDSKSARNVKC